MPARPRALRRYLAFRVPGLLVVGGALAAAVHAWGLSLGMAVAGVGLWLAKDALLYPALRRAYEADGSGPPPRPVGERGVAESAIGDSGWVRVGAELWRARAAAPIPAGAPVRVLALRGLVLDVERVADPGASPATRAAPH
jgi:membrane protein implicated in regulation of membrane protease activity